MSLDFLTFLSVISRLHIKLCIRGFCPPKSGIEIGCKFFLTSWAFSFFLSASLSCALSSFFLPCFFFLLSLPSAKWGEEFCYGRRALKIEWVLIYTINKPPSPIFQCSPGIGIEAPALHIYAHCTGLLLVFRDFRLFLKAHLSWREAEWQSTLFWHRITWKIGINFDEISLTGDHCPRR